MKYDLHILTGCYCHKPSGSPNAAQYSFVVKRATGNYGNFGDENESICLDRVI